MLRDVHEPAIAAPAPAPVRKAPPTTSPVRDAIAAAMSRSKREIPHYYLAHTISLKHALTWLADTNAKRPVQERILAGALLLRAVSLALWEIPELNGFWIDGAYRASEEVHLGTAIALRTGGLIAPGKDVEACEPHGPGAHEDSGHEDAEQAEVVETPLVHHEGRGSAEGDDIGQRVEVAAEIGLGLGQANHSAVESVEEQPETDGQGCQIQVGLIVT